MKKPKKSQSNCNTNVAIATENDAEYITEAEYYGIIVMFIIGLILVIDSLTDGRLFTNSLSQVVAGWLN